jgi:hypothetical protein
MKKTIILGLFLILCIFYKANAQSMSAKIVRFEIDKKEVKRSYKVFFLSNGKWIEAEKTSNGFVVPGELRNEKFLAVLITFGKYKLEFSEIHISAFSTNINWTVGIDKKPFSKEFAKPDEMKMIKRLYYIKFEGDGGLDTQLIVAIKKNK